MITFTHVDETMELVAKYFVQIINCNQHEVYNRVIKAVKPFCASSAAIR